MSDQSHDLRGNAYLTVAEAKPGMMVKCDGDFTCIGGGARRVIQANDAGELWIKCRAGSHMLDGQLSDDGAVYVGLYRADH